MTLSACVGFSDDGGMGVVAGVAGKSLEKDVLAIRTPDDAASARSHVELLLSRTLTADSAVQIALLNNHKLQAAYNALGAAEAARVKASLPPNPSFSFSRMSGPLVLEVEAIIAADILALATLPARAEIASERFHQAQLRAAEETLRFAARARRDYYRAVAAQELVDYLAKANSTAEAAAQLARALGETGAMNKLDQAREQVFYAELTAQLAKARQRAIAEREQLIRSLGLWGDDLNFKLAIALPTPPSRPRSMPMVEQEAVARRPDLFIAGIELGALAKSYGLVDATRFVNVFQLSGIYKDKRENITSVSSDGTIDTENVRFRDSGPGATIEIPIFDFGEARAREAEQTYMQAFNRLAAKAVDIRSEARLAYRTYRSAWDIANHYQREILPLRKIITDESLRRYNAMLIDVFPLLAEVRQRISATIAAIEAKRDFWLASADLRAAVIGGAERRVEETTVSWTALEADVIGR
jgi:outer membrane protein TolC